MRISDWSSDVCSSDLGIFQPWHAKLIVHHAKREIIRNKWLFGKDRIYKRFPVAGKAGKKSPVPFLLRANRAAGSVFERFSAQGAGPVRRIDQYMVRERKQFLPDGIIHGTCKFFWC